MTDVLSSTIASRRHAALAQPAIVCTVASVAGGVLVLVLPPAGLVRQLRTAGRPLADPASVIVAGMGLLAETLVAYLALVTVLHGLGSLPGVCGARAHRLAAVVTLPSVRRALTAIIGGLLVANLSLGTPDAFAASSRPGSALSAAAVSAQLRGLAAPSFGTAPSRAVAPRGMAGAATAQLEGLESPVAEGAPGGRAPPAGGPPEGATREGEVPGLSRYTIRGGDTLWSIAARHLPVHERTDARIAALWPEIYRLNRALIGPSPELILPGRTILVPIPGPASTTS